MDKADANRWNVRTEWWTDRRTIDGRQTDKLREECTDKSDKVGWDRGEGRERKKFLPSLSKADTADTASLFPFSLSLSLPFPFLSLPSSPSPSSQLLFSVCFVSWVIGRRPGSTSTGLDSSTQIDLGEAGVRDEKTFWEEKKSNDCLISPSFFPSPPLPSSFSLLSLPSLSLHLSFFFVNNVTIVWKRQILYQIVVLYNN